MAYKKRAGGYDCAGHISPNVEPFLSVIANPEILESPANLGAVLPWGSLLQRQ